MIRFERMGQEKPNGRDEGGEMCTQMVVEECRERDSGWGHISEKLWLLVPLVPVMKGGRRRKKKRGMGRVGVEN